MRKSVTLGWFLYMLSFYTRRSQKGKNYSQAITFLLCFWDLFTLKLLIKCWWNRPTVTKFHMVQVKIKQYKYSVFIGGLGYVKIVCKCKQIFSILRMYYLIFGGWNISNKLCSTFTPTWLVTKQQKCIISPNQHCSSQPGFEPTGIRYGDTRVEKGREPMVWYNR